MKKVELLAPAGNYESFLGAIHAGADAVYLGGPRFGARAYADNFTEEEVCQAIRYAHIYGRKVYLTLNTLIKEKEFGDIFEYMRPFYLAGLDGVIIQDLGVFETLGRWFPKMERHISTQMTVTGARGAALLKEMGAVRIVPARELSIQEIRDIKSKVDIEIENFVHGAICYCYSGQCLFSSIIGGRSGNRGRCAQPCRLPYQLGQEGADAGKTESMAAGKKVSMVSGQKEEIYPLSLKDMCTIEILPELIEAEIDSFKIEGRMKSPEYAAGVTAIYRKYIDLYYQNPAAFRVEPKDMEILRSLYIRSEISEGYYHKHNGKDMITLYAPGYAGRDEKLADRIRSRYLDGDFRMPIIGKAVLNTGEKAVLTLEKDGLTVTAQGDEVQKALKQPLTEENVAKQIKKMGNTPFVFDKLEIEMSPDAFLPVKTLNVLRRQACELLEEQVLDANGLALHVEREDLATEKQEDTDAAKGACGKEGHVTEVQHPEGIGQNGQHRGMQQSQKQDSIHVSVLTEEQLFSAIECGADRIYVAADLCMDKKFMERIEKEVFKTPKTAEMSGVSEISLYLALPHIIRLRDEAYLAELEKILEKGIFRGVLVRNMEELQWLRAMQLYNKEEMVSDIGMYIWNQEAYGVLEKFTGENYLPCELNIHEMKELIKAVRGKKEMNVPVPADDASMATAATVVYGRLPMMVTANCVAKTGDCCGKSRNGFSSLEDRYRKSFPVYLNCIHCYNIIYNSLPLSLHKQMCELKNAGIHTFRLDFTTENGSELKKITDFWKRQIADEMDSGVPPYAEYTKGHLKRGVE